MRAELYGLLCENIHELRLALDKIHTTVDTLEGSLVDPSGSLETTDIELCRLFMLALDTRLAFDSFKVSLSGWHNQVKEQLEDTRRGRKILRELSH